MNHREFRLELNAEFDADKTMDYFGIFFLNDDGTLAEIDDFMVDPNEKKIILVQKANDGREVQA